MIYTSQNFTSSAPQFRDGDELIACHCGQEKPHTKFGNDARGLVFRRCNLNNCDVPEDAVVESCSHGQLDWVAVSTIRAEDYAKRLKDEQIAIDAATAKILAEPIAAKSSIADAVAEVESRKSAEIVTAMQAVETAAAVEGKPMADLSDCTPRPDFDERGNVVSYTFYRRAFVD